MTLNVESRHNHEHLTHPKYRADIDGLRAFAILAVVGFHAFPNLIPGGFIGVDIFFVISGFLISTIIVGSLERSSFSFIEFYIRRINRIFPALILVLIASFAFGWFALLADEYKQLGKHIAGGAGFISNFIFWNESGYFDNAAETKPLLHLWSLGIEEQFYIVWPLMLWFAWKQRLNLLTITIIVALISFGLNISRVNGGHLEVAFYSPQTRFWELLVGSVLAYLTFHRQRYFSKLKPKLDAWFDKRLGPLVYAPSHEGNGSTLRNLQSLLGATLIAGGVFYVTKEKAFPGWWAVLPTAGALLIISAGKEAWLNRAVLSNRVMVWFGLISFPLYLWHWPLLSFARIVESETPSREIRGAAVLISIVLAWLTYRLIETPVRFGKQGKSKTAIVLICIMCVVGGGGYYTYAKSGLGFRDRIKVLEQMKSDAIKPDSTRGSDGSCESKLNYKNSAIVCLANSNEPDVLIVGDSHAMALNSAAYLNKINLKTVVVAMHGCVPLVGFAIFNGGVESNIECRNLSVAAITLSRQLPSIKEIWIETRGPFYFTGNGYGIEDYNYLTIKNIGGQEKVKQEEMFYEGYSKFVSELIAINKKVTFIIDVPELGEDPKKCLFQRPLTLTNKEISTCSQSKRAVLERQALYRDMVMKIQKDNPSLNLYDSMNSFCDRDKCYGKSPNELWYFDSNHISVAGSKKLLQDIMTSRR